MGIQMFPEETRDGSIDGKTMIPAAVEDLESMETVEERGKFRRIDQPGQRVRLRLDSTAVRVEHMGRTKQVCFCPVFEERNGV
jgi:hypothetical protein